MAQLFNDQRVMGVALVDPAGNDVASAQLKRNRGQLRAPISSGPSTNAALIKGSAGLIHCIRLQNLSASIRYFKFFDKASTPVVGTDTPIDYIVLAANSTLFLDYSTPIPFSSGIGFCITGALTALDNTAIGAAEVMGQILYS
jgi:hypothetical protein